MERDSLEERFILNGFEGFWSYAKERIIKFHGVSKGKFPLYLLALIRLRGL